MNTIYYNDLISTIERTVSQLQNDVLTTVGDYAFRDCSSLKEIDLPNATTVGSRAFHSCSSLKEIHFAAKNKEAIEALINYPNKFGATNATIYFDI